MSTPVPVERNIEKSIELLSKLTTTSNRDGENEVAEDFDDALYKKICSVKDSVEFQDLPLSLQNEISKAIGEQKNLCRWNFVCVTLLLMQNVQDIMESTSNETSKLISLSQKKTLQNSLQFVISLGLLQYLLPDVGVSLEKKSKHFQNITFENLKDFTKYKRLCFVVDNILALLSFDVIEELIVTKYLEDLLAALFQLSFVPFKKPTCEDSKQAAVLDLKSLDDNYDFEKITFSVWNSLEENKKKYRDQLLKLQNKTYRPFLVRSYLILLGSKKSPRWLHKNISSMLKSLVLEKNGVIFTIKGIVEFENTSPIQSSHCITVAKLVSSIFSELCDEDTQSLAFQLREILQRDIKNNYEVAYVQVAASAVALSFDTCPDRCKKFLLNEIFKPLIALESTEEETDACVNQLSNLYLLPTNNSVSIPTTTILTIASNLFFTYKQIKESVSYLKSLIKDLLEKIFIGVDEVNLTCFLNVLIFNEKEKGIPRCPFNKKVVLTDKGGIKFENDKISESELENGISVLQLIKNIQDNQKLISSLFLYLLQKYVSCTDAKSSDKKVVIIILLTELTEDENVLKILLKNPENIIKFVQTLLQIHAEKCDEDTDVIRVCLTFLTMVLYDLRKKRDIKWSVLTPMLPDLKKLFKSRVADVSLLANEVHNLISTRNVIGSTSGKDTSRPPLIEEIPKSNCEKAIEEACDPLLPVRAHALMDIISLIKKRDPETLAKKDRIMCLFQENLKDKDSFLYLRAIEGLSSMATLKPDDVLPLLCDEFISCSTPEIRLKVGEVLLRTVKLLNEFLHVYKKLLINTFLIGTKDVDNLVRASCLSNLGELCFLLEADVHDVLHEVITCALNIASHDKAVEPRRAAVFLISSLFSGLKHLILNVLDSSLIELYRTLKKLCDRDEDEIVRVQAGSSLDVLKENMINIFTAKPSFEKKIHVLDSPQ